MKAKRIALATLEAMEDRQARHLIQLSGGKDSAALAIYLRDRIVNPEYVFCDTGKELPETYAYLERLEKHLGVPIVRLSPEYNFDHWLSVFGGLLPSARMRWCTKYLKLKPFERHCGEDIVYSYVAIRADEERKGYVSTKPNIKPVFPFKEDGLCYADIRAILEMAGLGLPEYVSWRSRSGCYFCFFQRKIEWVGLLENHPDLFWQASAYEKTDGLEDKRFTWCRNESLAELARAERVLQIKNDHIRRSGSAAHTSNFLIDILQDQEANYLRLVSDV